MLSLMMSAVGRVALPGGDGIVLPLNVPLMTRTLHFSGNG